jgi:hypothetical protein
VIPDPCGPRCDSKARHSFATFFRSAESTRAINTAGEDFRHYLKKRFFLPWLPEACDGGASNRYRDDEGVVTTNSCTEARVGIGRFVGVPMLRWCGRALRGNPTPKLSLDGSSFCWHVAADLRLPSAADQFAYTMTDGAGSQD